MPRPTLLLVALAFCPVIPFGRAANLRLEASTAWAENINRATAPGDWRDAQTLDLRATASTFREWQTGFVTSGELHAGSTRVPRFTRLDAVTAGAAGQVRQKFGLGPYAPVLSFDAGLHSRFAGLDADDGWTTSAGVRLAKRLTPSWRAAATGDWQQHDARRAIFDTRQHRVFATVTWDFSERWSLTHGNGRLWGRFVANASPGVWPRALAGALGQHISSYYNTVPWGATDIFGPGWVSYRVDGHVSFWWLELSPAIGRNTSLPLRYENFHAVNQVGIRYRQEVWTIQLLHRF